MLRHAITSRQLRPGERLPAETKLAEKFGVARMTVRRALQQLRDEGIVVSASGRGLVVRPMPPIRELWPQEPGYPTQPTIPDFNAWGDTAPLIAQAENIRTRMYTLAGDLRALGELVGDPVVAAKLIRILAGIGLAEADVFSALAVRLHAHVLEPEHADEVFSAMETARRAFSDACGASQSAAKSLLHYPSAKPDLPTADARDPSSHPVDD